MLRYIALVWNVMDVAQQNASTQLLKHWQSGATRWRKALTADGLHVLCTGESDEHAQVHNFEDHCGIVLGTLFKRGGEIEGNHIVPLSERFDRSAGARIIGTQGQDLIDSYWGSYVAILRDAALNKSWIVRSPVGSLPCLTMQFQGMHIYFSSMLDCASCELLTFTINWQYLARHLGKMRQSGDTGLNEVAEIQYGECVEHGHDLQPRIRRYWNALDVARSGSIHSPAQATAAVRNTVRACVRAWGACQQTIALRLSGGLDSSIILSCLRDAPSQPQVICINRYSLRADSDEREFARLAAQHMGYELLELHRDTEFSLGDIFQSQPAERPQNYIMQFGQILPETQLAHSKGAGAIFEGTYGDELFYGSHHALTVADHIHDFGFRSTLLPVVVSAARAGNRSVWKVLRESVTKGLFQHRWDPMVAVRKVNVLINDDALRELIGSSSDTHPWYRPDRYVPPGKQSQIGSLMDYNGYHMPFGDIGTLRYISPLLSQPLVELCLRIPTYVLSRNGWNREIERSAFAADIPPRIARRRTKGGQADFSSAVKSKNHALIRDLLLSGWLVKSGLVDRVKLEEALAGRSAGLDKGPARLSRALNVEVWLRTWTDKQLRIAA